MIVFICIFIRFINALLIDYEDTKYIMLMHVSEHDNTYELAYNVNRSSIKTDIPILLSNKSELSEIIEI